ETRCGTLPNALNSLLKNASAKRRLRPKEGFGQAPSPELNGESGVRRFRCRRENSVPSAYAWPGLDPPGSPRCPFPRLLPVVGAWPVFRSGSRIRLLAQGCQQCSLQVFGNGNANDMPRPQFQGRCGDKVPRQADRAPIVVQVLSPPTMQGVARQADTRTAILPRTDPAQILALGIGQEDLA